MAWSNRIPTIVTVILLAGLGARAADLPPPPVALPAPNDPWSGPWIGVYGGWGFGSPKGDFSVTGDPQNVTPEISSQVNAAGAGAIFAKGGLGGMQGGWNLRLSADAVVGLEADIGYAGLSGSRSAGGTIPAYDAPFTVSQKYSTDWQAALRVRGGYLINPATLLFVEAGPALGSVHYKGGFVDFIPLANYSEFESTSAHAIKAGLTLGGGVEYLLGPNLSLRAEYLYTRFPSVEMSGISNPLLPVPTPGQVAHSSGPLNQNAFRFGVNYLFR